MFRRASIGLLQALLGLALVFAAPASGFGHERTAGVEWTGDQADTLAAKILRQRGAVSRLSGDSIDGDDGPDWMGRAYAAAPWPPIASLHYAGRSDGIVHRTHAARAGLARAPPTA